MATAEAAAVGGARAVTPERQSLLAFVFAFLCFFPYPAVALGSSTGLQASQAMALGLTPLILMLRPPGRHLVALLLLTGCLILSGYWSMTLGNILVADIMLKAMIAIGIAGLVLVPAGFLARPANLTALAAGAAVAILIHAAVGAYQAYSFSRETFPFLGFYQNPSFLPVSDVAEDYALWIKRPFGLFPEPSAMTSSVGPWLILFAGLVLGRGSRAAISRRVRLLLLLAIACGTALVLGARSGYAPLWVASALPILVFYPVANAQPGRARSFRIFLMLVVGSVLLVAAVIFASSQLNGEAVQQNDSWQSRQQSIVIGLTAPSQDLAHFLVGFGPGQSATYIQRHTAAALLPPWYDAPTAEDVIAVWSILGALYMETGLLGAALIVTFLVVAIRAIMRSSARLLGLGVLGAWLAGVTVTTSYIALSPIWLFLGLLLAWDRLFVAEAVAPAQATTEIAALPRPAAMTRVVTGRAA